jgi:hypothetical protein
VMHPIIDESPLVVSGRGARPRRHRRLPSPGRCPRLPGATARGNLAAARRRDDRTGHCRASPGGDDPAAPRLGATRMDRTRRRRPLHRTRVLMDANPGAASAVRHARGIAAYARIFGVPESQVDAAFAPRVGPVFAEEQLQAAGGAAWTDPALSGRDSSIAVITAVVAQGVTGDRLAAPPCPGPAERSRRRRSHRADGISRHLPRPRPCLTRHGNHPRPRGRAPLGSSRRSAGDRNCELSYHRPGKGSSCPPRTTPAGPRTCSR